MNVTHHHPHVQAFRCERNCARWHNTNDLAADPAINATGATSVFKKMAL